MNFFYFSILPLVLVGVVQASTVEAYESTTESTSFIAATANLSFASKYMADGFKIGGDHPVWQPSVEVSSPSLGVALAFWSSLQMDRNNQQYDELDFMALYRHDFLTGSKWALNLHGYFDYWTYPKVHFSDPFSDEPISPQSMHGNKLHAGVSFTNLFWIAGAPLIPSYNAYYWLYWAQNKSDGYQGGTHHEALLSYYHDIPKVISGSLGQYFGANGSLNYNDGAFGVRPGLSHSTAQLSTGIYAPSWRCSLALNQQWSYITSVDNHDELWTTLSFTKQF